MEQKAIEQARKFVREMDVIKVSKKPLFMYAKAVRWKLRNSESVEIWAQAGMISKAIFLVHANLLKHDTQVVGVETLLHEIEEDGRKRYLSEIHIRLKKRLK